MSLPFNATFNAAWNSRWPLRSRTTESFTGTKRYVGSLCLFSADVHCDRSLDRSHKNPTINARNGIKPLSSIWMANCRSPAFGSTVCRESLLHSSITSRWRQARTEGSRNREEYIVCRIVARQTATSRPEASNFTALRRKPVGPFGSQSLSTSLSVVWFQRRRARGRRGVTAQTDGKDKERVTNSEKPAQHEHRSKSAKTVRYEVHGFRTRPGRPTPEGPDQNVLLQAFNWESWKNNWWVTLKTKVEDLSSVGITDVWLPPASQAVDRQGYLPSQLYNLDGSAYGTATQLKDLIDEFHRHNICCIADIVINHRSGVKQDSKGHWNIFKGGNQDKRLDWGPWAVVDDDVYDSGGKGTHDTGESYGAAPDLDHTNKQVQDELTDWMNWMRAEIGFDGWRFDFVKGYHPKYTQMYNQRTNPTFAVGELWTSMDYFHGQLAWDQNKHRQVLCNWIDGTKGTSQAFDFTTKGILQRAVEGELWRLRDDNNKPPGLIGWYPQRAVTFLDNHDTGSTQRHWNFPDNRVLMGYAYILTHPGTPCIRVLSKEMSENEGFYLAIAYDSDPLVSHHLNKVLNCGGNQFIDHLYEFKLKDEIRKLVHLRKRHRINSRSKVFIQKAEGDIYVAKIDERVVVKLGSRMEMGGLLPDKKDWNLFLTGWDFAVWETTRPLGAVPEVHEDEPIPVPQNPVEQRTSHPVHLTSKMSEETKNRILKEALGNVSILASGNELRSPVDQTTPGQATPLSSTQTQKALLLVVILGPLLVFLII